MERSDASVVARERVRELVDAPLTREDRASLFRYMAMMRASEERALTLYKQGKVPGSFYDGRGQEAISVGAASSSVPATGCASCTVTSART
jgi:TPP-dependent pyruvate/acetoin dehydrogenase alpha subunit